MGKKRKKIMEDTVVGLTKKGIRERWRFWAKVNSVSPSGVSVLE